MANTEKTYELSCNMHGLSASDSWQVEADGSVDIVYEAERCTTAWLEVKNAEGVNRKIPILPNSRNGSSSSKTVKQGEEVKLVASIGRGGFFRAHLSY